MVQSECLNLIYFERTGDSVFERIADSFICSVTYLFFSLLLHAMTDHEQSNGVPIPTTGAHGRSHGMSNSIYQTKQIQSKLIFLLFNIQFYNIQICNILITICLHQFTEGYDSCYGYTFK